MAAHTLFIPTARDYGFVLDWNGDIRPSSPLHGDALDYDAGVDRSAGDLIFTGFDPLGGYLYTNPSGDQFFSPSDANIPPDPESLYREPVKNTAQTFTAYCPPGSSGQSVTVTVPANRFSGPNQEIADKLALNEAIERAVKALVCAPDEIAFYAFHTFDALTSGALASLTGSTHLGGVTLGSGRFNLPVFNFVANDMETETIGTIAELGVGVGFSGMAFSPGQFIPFVPPPPPVPDFASNDFEGEATANGDTSFGTMVIVAFPIFYAGVTFDNFLDGEVSTPSGSTGEGGLTIDAGRITDVTAPPPPEPLPVYATISFDSAILGATSVPGGSGETFGLNITTGRITNLSVVPYAFLSFDTFVSGAITAPAGATGSAATINIGRII